MTILAPNTASAAAGRLIVCAGRLESRSKRIANLLIPEILRKPLRSPPQALPLRNRWCRLIALDS